MKYPGFVFLLLIIPFITISADTEKEIKAGIKHVTVYPDRAQLTHETAVEITVR